MSTEICAVSSLQSGSPTRRTLPVAPLYANPRDRALFVQLERHNLMVQADVDGALAGQLFDERDQHLPDAQAAFFSPIVSRKEVGLVSIAPDRVIR